MKTKIKTKNKNKAKIKFAVFLFFALAQMGQADISLGASIIAQDMLELTNRSRIEAGLAPLAINEKLARAAQEKADDMFKSQYFDHNSPNGTTPWDFIKSEEYEYKYAGENLAIDFISANGAHKALMESSSHRDNILNVNYTEIGIAVKEDIFEGNKSIIIVEEFASPLYVEKTSDYNLNENVELILEEKANEINNPPKEEEEPEEFSQTGSTQEHEANELEEESAIEQDDDLSLSSLNANFDIWNPAFRLFENGQDKTLYNNYETLKSLSRIYFGSKFPSAKINLNEEKNSEAAAGYNQILPAGDLNNERIMGLASEASFKKAYLNKFKYQNNLSLNNYFQDELSARVLLLDLFLAILLIFDFWFIVRISPRNLMPKIN